MAKEPSKCRCGVMVVEDTAYDSSDQPYTDLFEVDEDGDLIRSHRCSMDEGDDRRDW